MKKTGLHNDIDHILFKEAEIKARVDALGKQLAEDYRGLNPIFVCIMKGSIHFFSDLVRHFDDYCEMDFVSASSYGDEMTGGSVEIKKDIDIPITGRHVVLIEDILDTGRTLDALTRQLSFRMPASLKIVTLLDKPEARITTIKPDYYGFVVPNEFVVGYGLDYAQAYRNLPFIGVLREEVYKN